MLACVMSVTYLRKQVISNSKSFERRDKVDEILILTCQQRQHSTKYFLCRGELKNRYVLLCQLSLGKIVQRSSNSSCYTVIWTQAFFTQLTRSISIFCLDFLPPVIGTTPSQPLASPTTIIPSMIPVISTTTLPSVSNDFPLLVSTTTDIY